MPRRSMRAATSFTLRIGGFGAAVPSTERRPPFEQRAVEGHGFAAPAACIDDAGQVVERRECIHVVRPEQSLSNLEHLVCRGMHCFQLAQGFERAAEVPEGEQHGLTLAPMELLAHRDTP